MNAIYFSRFSTPIVLRESRSNRTQVIYPTGKTVDSIYDELNRLNEVKVNTKRMTEYTYDPLNRRIQKEYRIEDEDAPRRTLPSPGVDLPKPGRLKDVIDGNIKPGIPFQGTIQRTSYTWDMGNQLGNLTNEVVKDSAISQYGYTYDNVGNRKTMTALSGTQNYGYNNIYELKTVSGAQTHSFDYDNVNNRKTVDGVTYVPNNLNQYNSVGGVSYSYDLNGNLTNDRTNTYTYDEENRLSSVFGLSSSVYTYDAFNRRISKKVDGVTTYFINDGDREIAEYNSGGNLEAEYVYGSGIDEVLTMDRSGSTYYYHTDGLGSVSDITNTSGSVVESYTYDVYGQPTILDANRLPLSASSINNPFLFTGRRFDSESGIYYYRNRMYSPTIGRFLQRDPIGYWDSMNLYSYVYNSPTNWVDPWGLCGNFWEDAWEIIQKNFQETLENFPELVWDELVETFYWPENHPEEVGILLLLGGTPLTGQTVYRVYGEGAGPYGQSWTPENPNIWGNSYRSGAGLPPPNTGQYAIKGTIKDPTGIIVRGAEPTSGNPGGITEYIIPNAENKIIVEEVGGANPPF